MIFIFLWSFRPFYPILANKHKTKRNIRGLLLLIVYWAKFIAEPFRTYCRFAVHLLNTHQPINWCFFFSLGFKSHQVKSLLKRLSKKPLFCRRGFVLFLNVSALVLLLLLSQSASRNLIPKNTLFINQSCWSNLALYNKVRKLCCL